MEMDPHERESDDGSVSHNDDAISDGEGESGRDQEDSNDDVKQNGNGDLMAEHSDVLNKLKRQVRDLRGGEEFEVERPMSFVAPQRHHPIPEPFHLPAAFNFNHVVPNQFMNHNMVAAAPAQPASSGSSHSSDGSGSSHTWSFEEQFKQVRQRQSGCVEESTKFAKVQAMLYELSDDPKRKEFLDDLFSFMQKKGTPINRLPIMAKSVLDLYELYNLVVARGGLVDVINKKLWQEIIKGLRLPSSITSAAFTLRTQYMKYLYAYECDKLNLSSPTELQHAIDGNRREGRRSSYGPSYDSVRPSPGHSQMQPLSMVAQHQQLARFNSVISGSISLHNGGPHVHPPLLNQPMNGGLPPREFEQRMMDLIAQGHVHPLPARHGEDSPPLERMVALNADITRLALLNQLALSTQGHHTQAIMQNHSPVLEPQKEALNLADSGPSTSKRQLEDMPAPPPKRRSLEDSIDVDNDEETEAETEADNEVENAKPMAMAMPSTHLKIESRGENGDTKSLLVSMDINGVHYQGVLFAQSLPNGK